MTLKIAVIGNHAYRDFLSENKPDWDWQVASETFGDFYQNLSGGTIDKNTPLLVIDPNLYEPAGDYEEGESFEEFVAMMSPHALVSVIAFNEVDDRTPRKEIQASVSEMASGNNEYSAHFYWLEADDILQSISMRIEDYVNAGDSDADARAQFVHELGLTPPEEQGVSDDIFGAAASPDTGRRERDSAPEYVNSLGKRGQIIAVTSAKGGSGKSTVAFALAEEIGKSTKAAARDGKLDAPLDVCLVDMDVYDGQLGFVIGVSHPTMLSIAHEPHIDQESVRRNLITNDVVQRTKKRTGQFIDFSALLAPKSARDVEDTPPDMWRRVIDILTTMFDVVVLDTSIMYFLDEIIYDVAYPMADKILYVTDLDIKSILDITRWMQSVCSPEEVGGSGIDLSKIGLVVNKGMQSVGMGPDKIKKIIKISAKQIYRSIDRTVPIKDIPVPQVLATILSYPKLVTGASNNQNLGAIIKVPNIEKAFRRLAKAVLPADVAANLVDVSDPNLAK